MPGSISSDEILCIIGDEGRIGEGSYGVVRLGFHDRFGVVAAKCAQIRGGIRNSARLLKRISSEVAIIQQANHENVVRIYGWTQWSNATAIIMEYLAGGNLLEFLDDQDIPIHVLLRLRICQEIASGISFIHNFSIDKRLIHGDIKAENILLTEDLHCKIADFGGVNVAAYTGMSSLTGPELPISQFTEVYASPEMLRDPFSRLKTSHDVYSYGIVMYVVLTRQQPVTSALQLRLYLDGVMRGLRPSLSVVDEFRQNLEKKGANQEAEVLDALVEVMKKCWHHDPCMRPNMLMVKEKLQSILCNNAVYIAMVVGKALQNFDVTVPKFNKQHCAPIHCFFPPTFDEVNPISSSLSRKLILPVPPNIGTTLSSSMAVAWSNSKLASTKLTSPMQEELPVLSASEVFTPTDRTGVIIQGSFSTTRICKVFSEMAVVKCFPLVGGYELHMMEQKKKRLIAETNMLYKCKSNHILELKGITFWPKSMGIVMEYLPGGDLANLLHGRARTEIAWPIRVRIAKDISEAVCYLHNYKPNIVLVHGDIKPENVLLSDKLVAKLADFGILNLPAHTGASSVTTDLPKSSRHTIFYAAPEFLSDPVILRAPAMDVYSFGVILYEILARQRVYKDAKLPITASAIAHGLRPHMSLGKVKLSLAPEYSHMFDVMMDLMLNCCELDPAKRPEMLTVRDVLLTLVEEVSEDVINKTVIRLMKTYDMPAVKLEESVLSSLDRFSPPDFTTSTCHKLTISSLHDLSKAFHNIGLEETTTQDVWEGEVK